MKAEARTMDVISTLEGEVVDLGIHKQSMAIIIGLLTDLYSDRELAVIREYSTNALDAHVDAGQTRPIEITTPSSLSPYFKVKDFGVGLDIEDIRNIYSQYGASTKRDSNDVVGMLGLGCKSALTYTDQFTLSAVKDGKGIQVAISRTEEGGGSLTVVDEFDTDQPNGVEIVVPAEQYNEFDKKAQRFFSFWEEGKVLVNGEQPKKIEGTWIADDLLLTFDADDDYMVMGNVAYPMENLGDYGWRTRSRSDGRYGYRYLRLVSFVNIGDVNFTPSRESLMDTPKTKAAIKATVERAKKLMQDSFEKEILDAANRLDAVKAYQRVKEMGFDREPVWNGEKIPMSVEAKHKFETDKWNPAKQVKRYTESWTRVHRQGGYGYAKGEEVHNVSMNAWDTTFFFTGYEDKAFSPHKRKKMNQWYEAKRNDVGRVDQYVLVKSLSKEQRKWIDPARIFNWQEVADQVLPKVTTLGNGRVSGSYEGWVDGIVNREIKAEEIDTQNPIFWVRHDTGRGGYDVIKQKFPKHTLVTLTSNRIKKFERDFPQAVEMREKVKELAEQWKKSLSRFERLALFLQNETDAEILMKFEAADIADPKLKQAVKAVNHADTKLDDAHNSLGPWVTFEPLKWENPMEKYPLLMALQESYRYDKMEQEAVDHAVLYLNAAFAAGGKA